MPRNIDHGPSVWFRRFMILTAVVICGVAIMAFIAMSRSNFALAFPLFVSVVILLGVEVVLMILHNRI